MRAILWGDDPERNSLRLFEAPRRVVVTQDLDRVMPCLQELEREAMQGAFVVGVLAYEAAPAFDPALQVQRSSNIPLLLFGVFDSWRDVPPAKVTEGQGYKLGEWQPLLEVAQYRQRFEKIKDHIRRGDTYQVNVTFPFTSRFDGDPQAFFAELLRRQPTCFSAYIEHAGLALCSVSPELFFRLSKDRLYASPMKGTSARGRTLAEDNQRIETLQRSEKECAENVMVVDMLRHDLGRIATPDSVSVPVLFAVERHPTLLQMTSSIEAQSRASMTEVLAALFPCASVTGAPKVKTMEVIASVEPAPRGFYTGAIGVLGPGRQAEFSVAIRTVTIDVNASTASYSVGSGVVWDSDADAEYAECLLKAKVIEEEVLQFDLLESILWERKSGYLLLAEHLQRLIASAEYFAVPIAADAISSLLGQQERSLQEGSWETARVRLLVNRRGRARVEAHVFAPGDKLLPWRVRIARTAVNSADSFLYHKTTARRIYEQALRDEPGVDDVILWNERAEITESTIANVVAEIDGRLYTPPLRSGLLGGVFRRVLLERGEIAERVLKLSEIESFRHLFLINSLRRWVPVVF